MGDKNLLAQGIALGHPWPYRPRHLWHKHLWHKLNNLKKQSQSPAFGWKYEALNPKLETYVFMRKKLKTKPIWDKPKLV
jgi:hypothetical protein